jgi:hypothetical protein
VFQAGQEVDWESPVQVLFALESLKETTMKKLFAPLLVPLLAFVLFACGSVPSNSPDSSGTPDLSSSPAITAPDSSEIPGLPEATETKLPPEVAALYADADLNDPSSTDSSQDDTLTAQAVTAYSVDPYTGLDTNAGTAAKPFKTIAKAISVVKAGQTVLLNRGWYSEPFGYVVPNGVTIKGVSTGVTLLGDTIRYGFNFAGSGSLQNLNFYGFTAPIFATGRTKGVITLSGLYFNSRIRNQSGYAIYATGPSELRVTNCVASGEFAAVIGLRGALNGTRRPKVVMQGGSISYADTVVSSQYADVTINGLTATNIKNALFMNVGSTAVITGSKFSTMEVAILMVGNGTKLKLRSNRFSGGYVIRAFKDFLEIDLGKSSADPGRNDFSTSRAIIAHNYGLTADRTVFAVGNRWKPNVQGSDAFGEYASERICNNVPYGPNYYGPNYFLKQTFGSPRICINF